MEQEKIQTGLRIPAGRYAELQEVAEVVGVSMNSLILMLVDLGLSVRGLPVQKVLLQDELDQVVQ